MRYRQPSFKEAMLRTVEAQPIEDWIAPKVKGIVEGFFQEAGRAQTAPCPGEGELSLCSRATSHTSAIKNNARRWYRANPPEASAKSESFAMIAPRKRPTMSLLA